MLIENMKMAFSAIRANKMRSALTMLGIIIGIGSVISIVSIGDTMRGLFADLYKDVGITQAYFSIGYWVDDVRQSDYFNLDDKQIFRDHEPVIYKVPQCSDGEKFYYREKKLSFTKTEDVQKRALQAIRKGKPLLFHWRGGYLTREVLSELLKLLEGTARQKGKHARTGLNWPQAVLHVTFIEEAPPEELVVEEANEGERQ